MSSVSTKLQLKFKDAQDDTRSFTYSHAKATATDSAIKNLMQCMSAEGNRSLFKYPPVTPESANIITTTTTSVDLS